MFRSKLKFQMMWHTQSLMGPLKINQYIYLLSLPSSRNIMKPLFIAAPQRETLSGLWSFGGWQLNDGDCWARLGECVGWLATRCDLLTLALWLNWWTPVGWWVPAAVIRWCDCNWRATNWGVTSAVTGAKTEAVTDRGRCSLTKFDVGCWLVTTTALVVMGLMHFSFAIEAINCSFGLMCSLDDGIVGTTWTTVSITMCSCFTSGTIGADSRAHLMGFSVWWVLLLASNCAHE